MPHKKDYRSLLGGYLSVLSNRFGYKRGFSLTELLIALGIVAVIAVLLIPVVTTRAQNKSFAMSYEAEVKQMLNSLEGLPVNENKNDIESTMMYVENDNGNYADNAGAYINKYMKVVKYCGNTPGDCFGTKYYEYANNERSDFNISDIKGACALLKNGVSICLKPQVKNDTNGRDEIQGWIDLNGPKGPNIYGRDLRTFAINLKQKAVFSEETPTSVIVPDPPSLCPEGEDCSEIEKDPCKVNSRGAACCKQEDYVVSGVDDDCCPWYKDESTGPNHLICYPGTPECDPETDPECKLNKCLESTISGPEDECCTILAAEGKHNPNCCSQDDDSDYCCSIHPETEKCCKKRIDSGKIQLTADNVCCTKYQSIYNEYSVCKPACEKDNNSKQCCETVARRNEITNPDDACCMYNQVNAKDGILNKSLPWVVKCCRLPEHNTEQCCKWKYDHIGTSLDHYTEHNFNTSSGTFDGCCHGNVRGIKYTEKSGGGVNATSKNLQLLSRCCTLDEDNKRDDKEDEICCRYFFEHADLSKNLLKAGEKLRRCCKYSVFRADSSKYPQCCSNTTDGIYAYDNSYSKVCCMSNDMYDVNVTPRIDCCFDHAVSGSETGAFWNSTRWDSCCSYGDINYQGHKANTEPQWQKNCCKLSRSKYPSAKAYNDACCLLFSPSVSASRDSWHFFDSTKNDCCESLDSEYGVSNRDKNNWTTRCCYGYKGGQNATKHKYYEQEAKCCKLSLNWTEGCCSESGLNNSDDKWKKNCCDNPTLYGGNSVYRENCCESNATDYTRKNLGENPSGMNAKNVDTSKHKEYCCHYNATNPHIECCKLFKRKQKSADAWEDWDGNKPNDT